ncbi:MAG: xanthine dehydrogenase family protein molybdopterin-binding subunit [Acidobacteriaceae bacterium]|nr:xanthine dehydrogenase family protein molybdopterin-binding subunit [Acidobacteriaceae bacterium]
MSTLIDEQNRELISEQEQHESVPRFSYGFELRRRDFFKLLGGGMLVCACAGPVLAQESGARRRNGDDEDLPQNISAWLHIAEDGKVTVYTGKVEVGQNIRTSLTQQVAEELRAPLDSIQLVMGDTALTPYDMGTFGSRTTPTMGPQLRMVSAAARKNLINLAAKKWNADPASLIAQNGTITDSHSKQSISYGELTKGQQLVQVIGDDPELQPPTQWRIAGTSVPKVDGRAFITGKHKYTSDLSLPGMIYGKVVRPSAFRATLKSVDTSEAEKIPGVTVVRDGNFVGVTAPDTTTALKAAKAVRAEWTAPQQTSEATLFQDVRKPATTETDNPGGPPRFTAGSIEQGFSSAEKTLTQTYTISYVQHVPLEPRAAVAQWEGGKLTVWTGTQRPFAVRDELAETFRIPKDKVRVMMPDTGAAYGGKHTGEAAIEAARLAKAAGKPVKLVWTREEEFTWAYFRPSGVIDVKSGVSKDGTVVAWEFHNYNSGPAGLRPVYAFANQHIEFHPTDPPLRQGSYRGLAAPANHFAREVHMDELAHLLNIEPFEFRMKNLTDLRARAVLQAAAKTFGWGEQKNSPTRGFGLALGFEKGSYVATCVEVQISGRDVQVKHVAEAFECGAVVNPNGLQNQIAGAIMMGLGGALFEAIHFDNGKLLNPHLAEYRVPRFSDMPKIDVDILDRKDIAPAGAGETPIMALAPAISNAIFAGTGIRPRSLPMVPGGLPEAKTSA